MDRNSYQGETMEREAIVVLGMHRSGTSTTAGLISHLGYSVGDSLMKGNETNPKGFFENYRLMFFNESLLRACHCNWHNTLCLPDRWWDNERVLQLKPTLKNLIVKEFREKGKMLFKDPRLCILLPFYLQVFEEMNIHLRFLITLRKPRQVIQSLHRRDHFTPMKSARLWIDHMLKAEFYTRGYPRTFIDYEEVLKNPLNSLNFIRERFTIGPPDPHLLENRILDFVEPSLNHSAEANTSYHELQTAASSIYSWLKERLVSDDMDTLYRFDMVRDIFYHPYTSVNFPLITVIIICGQSPDLVTESLLSIAGQNYPALESILMIINKDFNHLADTLGYLFSQVVLTENLTREEVIKLGLSKASGKRVAALDAGNICPDADTVVPSNTKGFQGLIWEIRS